MALRLRLRELAGSRVRYGYRRLTILLRREGWAVNAKRVYRLYRQEGLQVRTTKRATRAGQAPDAQRVFDRTHRAIEDGTHFLPFVSYELGNQLPALRRVRFA